VFGKILGAMNGLIVGLAAHSLAAGLALAAIGTIIGHRIDLATRAPEPREPGAEQVPLTPTVSPSGERGKFVRALCQLFVGLARVDGDVVRDEVRVVREFFENDLGWPPEDLESVRAALKASIARPLPLDEVARRVAGELLPSEKLLLVNALYELGLADGPLKRDEREAIKRVVGLLGVSEEEHRSITALHFGEGEAHYSALGLSPKASNDEVRSAFRRLAASHHPDKVAHLGPKASTVAERRFREIKDAYDEIRRLRGL